MTKKQLIELWNSLDDDTEIELTYAYSKENVSDDALREGIAHFGITQYQIDNWLKKYVDIERQKMKEAGYEWNAEKKELKKSKCMISAEAKEAMYDKSAWSEEDENAIKVLMNIIKKSEIIDPLIYTDSLKEKLYDWLKSLKERVQLQSKQEWKPSDEQMHYLSWIANIKLGDGIVEQVVSKHLNELYEDLKKLKRK